MPAKHIAVTHWSPQVSDLLSLWLLENYATDDTHSHIRKGVRTRLIRDGGRSLRDIHGIFSAENSARITHIGVGGGAFDEHGKNIPECEASLIGRDLGFITDVHLRGLSPEERKRHTFSVRRNGRTKTFFVTQPELRDIFAACVKDDMQGSPPFSLGNLVTSLYGVMPRSQRRVRNWTFGLFHAASSVGYIPREKQETAHREAAERLLEMLEAMQARSRYDPLAGRRLRVWLEKRIDGAPAETLDLVDCVAVMRHAHANERAWMRVAIRAELAEQHHFHTITPAAAGRARIRWVTIRIRERDGERLEQRRIAAVRSDDPYVHRYLCAEGLGYHAAAVIRQNSSGQIQIIPGGFRKAGDGDKSVMYGRKSFGFLMKFVAALIRAEECRKKRVSVPAWDELITEHGPREELRWFLYAKTGWLLNGAHTAPDVEPTRLTLAAITDIVVRGFGDEYSEWRTQTVKALRGEG